MRGHEGELEVEDRGLVNGGEKGSVRVLVGIPEG